MTDEMEIERDKSTEHLKQAIYRFLRDHERREHEHRMNLGHGLIKDPVRLIADLGSFYLNSYRGKNDTAADGAFHNELHRVSRWKIPLDFPASEMLRQLEFRLNQMSTQTNTSRSWKSLHLTGNHAPNSICTNISIYIGRSCMVSVTRQYGNGGSCSRNLWMIIKVGRSTRD